MYEQFGISNDFVCHSSWALLEFRSRKSRSAASVCRFSLLLWPLRLPFPVLLGQQNCKFAGGKNLYKLSIKCTTTWITAHVYMAISMLIIYTYAPNISGRHNKGPLRPISGQIRVGDDGHTLGDNVANCFRTSRPDSDGPENQLS